MLLVALIAIDELVGPALFRTGLARAGEIDANAPRPLLVVSNREPYLHKFDDRRPHHVRHGDRRRRGGARRAHARAWRHMDRARSGHGRSRDRRCQRQDACPARQPGVRPAAAVDSAGRVRCILRRLCQRGAVAVVSSRRRAAEVPDRGLGRVSRTSTRSSLPRSIRKCRRPTRRCFFRTTTSRWRRRICAERRPNVRTALFWHIPWPNPDRLLMCQWRRELLAGLLANDLVAFQVERDRRNFILAVQDELGAEIEADGASVRFKGRSTTVVSPCQSASITTGFRASCRRPGSMPAGAAATDVRAGGEEHRRRRSGSA